jgi:hypothetical protein
MLGWTVETNVHVLPGELVPITAGTPASVDADLMQTALDRATKLTELESRDSEVPMTIDRIVAVADQIYRLLTVPVPDPPTSIRITVGTPTVQGEGNSVQLHDNEQVVLTVSETDAKGVPVSSDTLSWTSADETIAKVNVDANTTYTATIVAGTVGSTTITVSDGNLSATEAIDVIPGPAAAITIGEGTPVPQAG